MVRGGFWTGAVTEDGSSLEHHPCTDCKGGGRKTQVFFWYVQLLWLGVDFERGRQLRLDVWAPQPLCASWNETSVAFVPLELVRIGNLQLTGKSVSDNFLSMIFRVGQLPVGDLPRHDTEFVGQVPCRTTSVSDKFRLSGSSLLTGIKNFLFKGWMITKFIDVAPHLRALG